jgi:hypothetical protein
MRRGSRQTVCQELSPVTIRDRLGSYDTPDTRAGTKAGLDRQPARDLSLAKSITIAIVAPGFCFQTQCGSGQPPSQRLTVSAANFALAQSPSDS